MRYHLRVSLPREVWIAAALAVAVVNVVTWAVFRIDKRRAAQRGRRIPEARLLTLAAVGGAAGALVAMYSHRRRHKTAKRGFAAAVWLLAAAQVAVAVWVASGAPT